LNYLNLNKNNYSEILEILESKSLPNIGYSFINTSENYKIIQSLFNSLNIDVKTFNENAVDKIDLYSFNFKVIEQAIEKKSSLIKSSLWKSLENSSIDDQAKYLTVVGEFEDKKDFVSENAEQNKFLFLSESDLNNIVQKYIEKKYPILELCLAPELYEKRVDNLNLFNTEEQYFIESNLRFKSLMFFESAIKTIRTELKVAQLKNTDSLSKERIEILPEKVNTVLLDSNQLKSKSISKSKLNGGSGVYVPVISNEKKNKERGNFSEKTVLDYFIKNEFKDIDPVAKFDEGLHYDIRYTSETGDVKYVEVKTFDYGSFHLSKSEYDFGLKNKENYEIWLVKDKNIIIPIYDFFSNPKYKTTVNEYLVHLEIV